MSDWLLKQWNDVKGNVKFWALAFVISSIVLPGAKYMLDGIPLWRQIGVIVLFALCVTWAIVASWKLRKTRSLLRNAAVRELRRWEEEFKKGNPL